MIAPAHRILLALFAASFFSVAAHADAPAPPPVAVRDVSLDDYRQHLAALKPIVAACAAARDTKTCNPDLVGPDDQLAFGAARRIVRYDWLRALLQHAQLKDDDQAGVQKGNTTADLLRDAQDRLDEDAEQASSTPSPVAAHPAERNTMRQVLAGEDFRGLNQQPPQNAFLEKINDWLNNLFARAGKLRFHSPWVGRVLVWGFILGVCIALMWALLQWERRWRIRLVPDDHAPAPGAASARNWQLWLEDARRAASAGQWRDAVHFLYWAAISRLESRRLWPADRARTPREYLALVAAGDARKPDLTQLTGSFERIWYGGRPAGEDDYRRAEQLALALIEGQAKGGAQ